MRIRAFESGDGGNFYEGIGFACTNVETDYFQAGYHRVTFEKQLGDRASSAD